MTKKPAVWPVVVWPVLILVLTVAAVWPTVQNFIDSLAHEDGRMMAPGTMEVELDGDGPFHVWFFTDGEEPGTGRRVTARGPGGEQVEVRDVATGSEIEFKHAAWDTSKEVFGQRAESAGVFDPNGATRVEVTVEGGPERVVAVSSFDLVKASMGLGMGVVLGLCGVVLGLVLLVVLLLVRARRMKLWRVSVAPPLG